MLHIRIYIQINRIHLCPDEQILAVIVTEQTAFKLFLTQTSLFPFLITARAL